MPPPEFAHSQALSIGVELELQLVNPVDFDLTSAANDLLELLSREPFPGTVTPEMTQSMTEIASGVQTRHAPLLAELRGMRDSLTAACDRLNMEATSVIKSMKDFYCDIRSKPEYGTIELRVCDTPLTVERAAALACYLQAICSRLLDRAEPPPSEDD